LVADDDADDRALLRLAAKREGVPISIHEVKDGGELMEYLEGAGEFANRELFPFPELVVIDLKMPRVDGFDVLKWLRRHPDCCRLPTVMLSGSGLGPDIAEAYRLGVNTYFTKPGDLDEFRKLIRAMFEYWEKSQLPV